MLNKLRDAVIASVRLRASQGDCPTEPAHSVETLESVILDLARAVDAVPAGEVLARGRAGGQRTSRRGGHRRLLARIRRPLARGG